MRAADVERGPCVTRRGHTPGVRSPRLGTALVLRSRVPTVGPAIIIGCGTLTAEYACREQQRGQLSVGCHARHRISPAIKQQYCRGYEVKSVAGRRVRNAARADQYADRGRFLHGCCVMKCFQPLRVGSSAVLLLMLMMAVAGCGANSPRDRFSAEQPSSPRSIQSSASRVPDPSTESAAPVSSTSSIPSNEPRMSDASSASIPSTGTNESKRA